MNASEPVTVVASCPTCHGAQHEKLPTPGRWIGREVFEPHRERLGLSRCTDCGLVFVNPRPDERLLAAFYGGHTYECHRPNDEAAWLREKAGVVLDRVQQHVPGARRILDYGCGGGFLLRAAREMGLDAVGLDIGGDAQEACRGQGFTVVGDPSELESGSFDAIVMHHVFEHIPDPRRALQSLGRLLTDAGRLFIEVPNVSSLRARLSLPVLCRWLGFDERHRAFPIHLWYFEPRTLKRLLSESGFDVVAVETYGMGIDELFYEDESAAHAGTAHAANGAQSNGSSPKPDGSGPSPASLAKNLLPDPIRRGIKRVLFDASLGENVLAVGAVRH